MKNNFHSKEKVYVYYDNPNKKEFIKFILKDIPFDKEIGYAGYKNKSALKKFLNWSIYGDKKGNWENLNEKEIRKEINKVLFFCKSILENKKIKIFVFPTIDSFIIKKMDGVSGFSIWKNTIIINISSTKKWRKTLRETVCHELAHALALNFNKRKTIQDDLIFEGIAEHFREHFIGGGKAKWVRSIKRKQIKQILKDIKPFLKKRDNKIYEELFFGSKKYPLWSGYAIGYYLVGSYLKKQKKINWKKIIKIPPKEIIKFNISSFN